MPGHLPSSSFWLRLTFGTLAVSFAACATSTEAPIANDDGGSALAPDAEEGLDGGVSPAALVAKALGTDARPEGAAASEFASLPGGFEFTRVMPLRKEKVPAATGLHIVNMPAAVRLGKALFWDVQVGSDGQTACATCHFKAGTDDRTFNTMNPGIDGVFASGGVTGPGQAFTPSNIANNDRIGSQGVVRATFTSISADPNDPTDVCELLPVGPFGAERRVGARNTPTMIGAVYFRENFWDGLANHVFNGRNPFGQTGNGSGPFTIENASLASQAVAPPVDDFEMNCTGRPFAGTNSLATKLLARTPLRLQQVAANDGVLGALANPAGPGLVCNGAPCTYRELIRSAMGDSLADNAEAEFTLIWGEALFAYQATLVPDNTPFDRFLEGNLTALSVKQILGLAVYLGPARCNNCHNGGLLSDATYRAYEVAGPLNADGGDTGFHNLGLRPFNEDPGRGRLGPGGAPVSVSGSPFDRGAFKTPSLRNIKLTAPYFHQGGKATLGDVVDFYAKGGRDVQTPETTSLLQPFTLTNKQREALIDFLAEGLTDCRVEKERAPFDHPELPIPNRVSGLPAVGATGTGACP
jgi:cytochrome c peroxidase